MNSLPTVSIAFSISIKWEPKQQQQLLPTPKSGHRNRQKKQEGMVVLKVQGNKGSGVEDVVEQSPFLAELENSSQTLKRRNY
jgi:hypothetical protein